MRLFSIQLLVIFALMLPSPLLLAGGRGEETVTTTTTTTPKKTLKKKKAKKGKLVAATTEPIGGDKKGKGKERADFKDDATDVAELMKDAAANMFTKTTTYLTSDEGIDETVGCLTTFGRGIWRETLEEREGKRKITAMGLIEAIRNSFIEAIEETTWKDKVSDLAQLRRVRAVGDEGGSSASGIDADDVADIATGCCAPFLKSIARIIRRNNAVVDKDGKINKEKLAADIAKAIAVAAKETLEDEEAVDSLAVLEDVTKQVIEEAKGKLKNDQLIAAIALVEQLAPSIIAKAKAEASAQIDALSDTDVDGDDD